MKNGELRAIRELSETEIDQVSGGQSTEGILDFCGGGRVPHKG